MKTNFEFIHYLILGLTFFFAVMAICIYRKAKRDAEKIFNSDYENLIRAIRSGKSEQKYYTILAQFHRLRKTPGVNHEKLDVAWAEFVKTFRDLQKANHHLRIENIKMRLELEALATDVNSVESLKIILKYRKLKMQRDEIDWSAQN